MSNKYVSLSTSVGVKTSPTPPTELTRLVARTKPWWNCCDWPACRPGSPSRAVSCRTERTGSRSAPPGCYSIQTSRGRWPFWAARTEISTADCAPRIDPSGSAYCDHLAHGVRGGWLRDCLLVPPDSRTTCHQVALSHQRKQANTTDCNLFITSFFNPLFIVLIKRMRSDIWLIFKETVFDIWVSHGAHYEE